MRSKGARSPVSLIPDEFLFPTSVVVLESETALDADLVRRTVGVAGGSGRVRIELQGRRVTWRAGPELRPGRYALSVDLQLGGEDLSGRRIPFSFVRSRARIPAEVAVESFTRLVVNGTTTRRLPAFAEASGRYIELMKGVRRDTGAPVDLAFNASGRPIDADAIWARLERARLRAFGKLSPALARRLRRGRARDTVGVAIWAAGEAELRPGDKPAQARRRGPAVAAPLPRELAAAAESIAARVREMAGTRVVVDRLAPVVFARLSQRAVRELAADPAVARVFLYDPRGFDDLEDSIEIHESDVVHGLGATGNGVRAAVWERGPSSTANLNITDRYDSTPSTSGHSTLVHAIIANTERNGPNGHAPDVDLYSANSYDLAALRWAVGEGCTAINQSFHREDEQTDGDLSFDDIYKDWLILRSPYPTIIQAAGNGADDEFVNHKGFNSIAVANHDDSATALSGTSVFTNPDSPHGDRELPEIAANGTIVAAAGESDSGTSFASPAVVGIAALLQDEASVLRSWPEGCRALLLAGAKRNVTDSTWWQDVSSGVDASDGSGSANALESFRIAQNRSRRGNTPARRGWDIGVLADGDFGPDRFSTFSYRVRVPSGPLLWVPTHVKVALTWNSSVTELNIFGIRIPISSRLTLDFDLHVFDSNGAQVAASASWDNSYEIAEFDGLPGREYTIRIRRWSGTGWSWYGLAWTVTGGLRDFILIDDLLEADTVALLRQRLPRPRPRARRRARRAAS
jgi:Subtilase family